ncbi:MAG: hypothetical protein OEX18_01745 [Candidatus Krumholzibacteria bacterium]|nr:hypothetical protein [Candidatus Krumholzibacteria bacterium]MDH4335982.1 hypothetical protein [Candidatus Krumholzibacteria bacterium]MDH5268442.1 hypothetical protein [Candidatus Krumholzibacteria bacterium]MDH5627198.1 hypothetical protein [Candidatus Krumholzibacteria bacterium]
MNGPSHPRLVAWRCPRGHVQLHGAPACPACGERLRPARLSPDARLIATTTVRVNPQGRPFVLGIAVTRCGRARTLCVVRTRIRGNGRDAVRLCNEDGVVVARAARVKARSPGQSARRGGSRRN